MKKLLLLTLGMCCLGFVNAQKVDDVFQYENLKYKITAYRKVILVKDKYSGNIIVPSKVVYNNIEYSVVQIPIHTFYDCVDLKSITIPSSVTDIVGTAFSGCTGLETIIVDENNPKYYSSGNCIIERETNCLIAGCKNSVIPEGVTSISEYAFDRCGLLTINIPSSLTTIPTLAFYAPYSEFEAIIIDENNPKYYSSGNCIIDKETKTLISGCNNSIIPNGITTIGNNAFLRCYYLTSVILPNGVTTIGNSAFSSCSSLTSITIPNSLTTIGSYAFFYCSGLKSITIPNSITTIGSNAFKNCINLKKIVCLSKEVPIVENNTFSSVSPDILLVPIGSAEAYKNANVWKNFSSKIIEGYVVNGLSTNENMGYVSVLQAIVEPNKTTTLTATAANGYHFTQWSDGNTENPRTVTIVSDTAFTAEFAINVYNVTASATNGTVDGVGEYTHGASATLTATATNGYHFTQWSDGNTENPRTITVVSDTIFIAEFVTNDTDKNNDNSVDINSISENTLSVYPSPASDVINIVGAENGAMVRIYNISGRMVHTSYLETSLFNVSNLPQGVYFIEVENCGRTKFVKQ